MQWVRERVASGDASKIVRNQITQGLVGQGKTFKDTESH